MTTRSLRTILFANSALAIFLPLLLVLFFGWLWLVPLISRGVNAQQHQLAEAIAGQVESFLTVAESHVTTIARLHPEAELTAEYRRHVQHVIYAAVKSVPHLRSLYLVDADGRIGMVGLMEDARVSSADLQGLDMTGNDLFRQTRTTGNLQWSETFLSVVGSGLSVAVAAPSGPRVLIGEIDLAELSLFLRRISMAKDRQLFVIDRRGQIIADQSGRYTAQQINLSNNELIQNSIKTGADASGLLDLNGTVMVGSIQKIRTLDWWVLVTEPRATAYRQVWVAVAIAVAGLLVTALTVLAASLVFSYRLARQIEALASHARNIANDEIVTRWPGSEIAELDSLAMTLQEMSSTLHERAKVLEHEIAERQKMEEELHLNAALLEEEVSVRQRTEEALRVKQLQLEAVNDSLEQRVREELAKNREKDLLMMQQSRLAAMGEMLSNIAHQWRQPLNELGILIQMVRYDYEDGLLDGQKVGQFIDSSMSTIQYMSNTINDFRDFFKQDRVPRLFDLEVAIQNAVGLVRASLQHYGITVTVELDRRCMVMGYANELSQALLNIINNARDVLVERNTVNPTIEVICRISDGEALITISDNAGGVTEEIIDKIFDPYFTTRHKSQGTGLGLYMTRMILESKLGGRISVVNTAEGAQFRIVIPCEQEVVSCGP
ncbi:sensor histidine kinase [Trichlorobacter ammonificans]|uniref:histidine kinase n=1 Tax=Trichlorobacter ammonificans TaxID=2916410 RepID=A0ABM9DDF2_9BACT|nr:ATP-binding protein [Trichlorobacter ammonificans]CAH2032406.1 Histidine kinase [Trichlorobacter ammonificans]